MTPLLSGTRLRVLLATSAQERPTVRSVAAAAGYSVQWTHRELFILRHHGWVTWEDGKHGTLRSTLAVVALSKNASGCTASRPLVRREPDTGGHPQGFETAPASGVGPGSLCSDCGEFGVDPSCYCRRPATEGAQQ